MTITEAALTNIFSRFLNEIKKEILSVNLAVIELSQNTEKELNKIRKQVESNAEEHKQKNKEQNIKIRQLQETIEEITNKQTNYEDQRNTKEIETLKNRIEEMQTDNNPNSTTKSTHNYVNIEKIRGNNTETISRNNPYTNKTTAIMGTNKKRKEFKREHEIVLSKIPNIDKLDEDWLKEELNFPTDIKVLNITKLEPTTNRRIDGKKYPTKSYKCTIETEKIMQDIFRAEYYPEQVRVDRYRHTNTRNYNNEENTIQSTSTNNRRSLQHNININPYLRYNNSRQITRTYRGGFDGKGGCGTF